MPPAPADGGRARNGCVYLVSCVLLTAILGGGAFLVLYITLPESEATAWFPVAGMVLVGTPWAFWMMTCLYRSMSIRRATATTDRSPGRAAATGPPATVSVAANEESAADSPGGARQVRFGNATVLGGTPEASGGGRGGGGVTTGEAANRENGEGSSHASHESELPLFVLS